MFEFLVDPQHLFGPKHPTFRVGNENMGSGKEKSNTLFALLTVGHLSYIRVIDTFSKIKIFNLMDSD